MTVEEALLAVVGVVAVALLFLGLAEALEGESRARLRRRRRRHARREAPRAGLAAPGPRAPRRLLAPPPSSAPAEGIAPASTREDPVPPTAALPDDPAAPPLDAARGTVTDDRRDHVAALIRAREFGEARELLGAALGRRELDRETAGFLLEVCSTAVARDLWRLRRALPRGGGDEGPLDGSLETTRVLLDAEVAQALPREQRRRMSCGLWRGHTRLGLRRWRAGSFEAAVEALFHALAVRGIDERRRRLSRDLLVRTLEDMAGQSLELIPQFLGDGDRAAALEQAQRLLGHIRRTQDEGASSEDLAVAASRARQLLEHIEQPSAR